MALLPVFIAFMLLSSYGVPYYIAFPATLIFALILGCFWNLPFCEGQGAQHPGSDHHHHRHGDDAAGFVSWKFGADQRAMPFPISSYDSIIIGDIFISTLDLLTLVVALVIMLSLFLFFAFPRWAWP
jgi:branched-chain amino acid transport system permease protein